MGVLKIDSSLISSSGASDGDVIVYRSANSRYEWSASGGGGVSVYSNVTALPLSNVSVGSLAYVESINRLYVWQPGWYNIPLTSA